MPTMKLGSSNGRGCLAETPVPTLAVFEQTGALNGFATRNDSHAMLEFIHYGFVEA